MKMIKKFNTFRGDETAFRYWLFRIACNEINSYFRTANRQARAFATLTLESDAESPDIAADCERDEDNDQKLAFLNDAIAELKPDQQDIITLRFFEGLNSEQIGDILDMKAATVRSRLARAIHQLKNEYKNRQQHIPEGLSWHE